MNNIKLIIYVLSCFSFLTAQQERVDFNTSSDLKIETEYGSENIEINDMFRLENIDYQKIKFSGDSLIGKSYKLSVKEIWNGIITSDSVIIHSKNLGYKPYEILQDSVFQFRIISKNEGTNILKMKFIFSGFSITKEFKAIDSDLYSLRNIPAESDLSIGFNNPFYLLAYILPYEREDGSKSWCEVGSSGKDIENWGKRFGIEHYLLFEMTFE